MISLGIELGSTRIKAQLIDENSEPVASGSFDWENKLEDGYWTYHLDDVWIGLKAACKQLIDQCPSEAARLGALGISAMMHGYLAFDKSGRLLTPFRTWRNTTTDQAARILTEQFNFNIPIRWSISHLYQSILNEESHVKDIAFITTLSGYVHWKLTGEKVIGIGDASGMFPIDSGINDYNKKFIEVFDTLIKDKGYEWKLSDILPKIVKSGSQAGTLRMIGARMLDSTGVLRPGIPFCPPEGDAGTGMVATNSIAPRTGNISAGTSIFAMVVPGKEISAVYPEIDIVATPSGNTVALVHCNNCSGDLDAWVRLFGEAIGLAGIHPDKSEMYTSLYSLALEGEPDCGGLLSYNYLSGEHITGLEQGRPLFTRLPDSRFTLANFIRSLLFSSVASLKLGMDILTEKENVRLDILMGHGGIFKTKGVMQRFLAAALETPVSVMTSAGEGGAWGIALLAAYIRLKEDMTLEQFLEQKVFIGSTGQRIDPNPEDVAGFKTYIKRYIAGLAIERAAADNLEA